MALWRFFFSSSCVHCMRSTRLWRKSWTGTRTIRASHLFTFLLNWPGWSPLKKIWNTSMVRTGERRLSFLQPLKDTATGSDRYVLFNLPWITCMFLSLLGDGQLTLFITPLPFLDWQRKPWIPACPCLYPVSGWPVWGTGSWSDRSEVHGSEKWWWSVLLCLPWGVQPQPVQTALSQPNEQCGADRGGEERCAGGGCQSLWVQHSGKKVWP